MNLHSLFRIVELRNRILFTFAMLVVFRLGAVIPIPGINLDSLNTYFLQQQSGGGIGTSLVNYLDFFCRGSIFTVFYIYARGSSLYFYLYYHATSFCNFSCFEENIRNGRWKT